MSGFIDQVTYACDDCGAELVGHSQREAAAMRSKARRHAQATGHTPSVTVTTTTVYGVER